MARTRLLKPSFFKNDLLGECDLMTRFLFQGLWCLADREGKLLERPKLLKAEILPYDNGDVTVMLQKLSEMGFITRYEINGEKLILINKFLEHQHPHHTEIKSILPNPPNITVIPPLDNGETPSLYLIPSIDTLSLKPSDDFKKNEDKRNFNFNPNEETHTETLRLAPGWDRQALYEQFSIFIKEVASELPIDPQRAFKGWVVKFIDGKNRNRYRKY